MTGDELEGFLDDVRSSTPRASIGTATSTSRPVDIADLYARADAELYRGRKIVRGGGSEIG